MARKKTIELVEDSQLPQALIVNGESVSASLAEILSDRGCHVVKLGSYSPTPDRFDYIFLFDNHEFADEIFEKNLAVSGKFIFIETGEVSFPFRNKFKILKIGDPSFWSMPELTEKILKVMFSSDGDLVIDLSVKPKPRKAIPSPGLIKIEGSSANSSLNQSARSLSNVPRDSARRPVKQSITPPLVEKQRINFKFLLAVVFIFLGALLIITGLGYWRYVQLQKTLAKLQYHLKGTNMSALTDDFRQVKNDLKTIKTVYDFSTNLIFPVKNISFVKDTGIILEDAEKITDSGMDFSAAVSEMLPAQSGFGKAGENLSVERLGILEKKLANFTAILIEAQRDLDRVNIPYLSSETVKATLSPFVSKLAAVYEIISPIKEIFFQDNPKVYLVLLQNNMELRPTGGFIGAFALVTVDRGKIIDFKIQDVYEADGQLKGHVDPPPPIRKYLEQPHFFLRDSNFDPDFAATSIQAAWFLEKELGKEVDGVIGVNLTLAQKILSVIGPVKLSDFNGEEITADNFFPKVHALSQANFFPGSTAKKDVLTAITNSIFAKLTADSSTNFMDLLHIVKLALEEKNILIYLTEPQLQKIVEDHSWAGRVTKVSCAQSKNINGTAFVADGNSCLADYLSIVEANLGVNKANYFISKSTIIEKKIQADDQIKTTVTISYENSVNTAVDTGQQYVNYLRIFTPLGSKLESVTLNSAPINPQDVDTQTYGGDKTVFGFLLKIAPENKGVVKIAYTLPRSFSSNLASYQLYYQKQAGDKNSPLVLSFRYPEGSKLTPVNFSFSSQREGEIYYTTDTSVDRVFALKRE